MRRPVVALVMAAVALSLTACGGAPAPAPQAAAPPAAAPAAPVVPVAVPVSTTDKLSPSEAGTGQPFPSSGPSVPKAIAENIAAREPMLVFFYDPDQLTTRDQRLEIESALREYRGLIDLVELDVTSALPDPVTKKGSDAPIAQQTSLLVQELKVGFTPYIILVDKQGMMTARYRGYVDRTLLDREILRATQ